MQSSHLFPFPLLMWGWGRGNRGDDRIQKWHLQVINRVRHAGWRRAEARREAGGRLKRAEGWQRGRGGRGRGGVVAVLSAEPASSLSAEVDEGILSVSAQIFTAPPASPAAKPLAWCFLALAVASTAAGARAVSGSHPFHLPAGLADAELLQTVSGKPHGRLHLETRGTEILH